MAAGDLVQVGQAVEVGLGGMAWKGIIQSVTGPTREADVNDVRDERDAVVTKIYTNPRRTIQFSLVVKDASHADLAIFEAMLPGDDVALNTGGTYASRTDEDWLVQEAPRIERGGRETRVTISCIREDSMGAAIEAIGTATDLTA